MEIAMWSIGGVVGILILFVLVMYILGKRLPERHLCTATLTLDAPAAEVFEAISNVQAWPTWDKGVTRVDTLADRDGKQALRMHMGRNSFVLVRTRHEPPRVLEMTIADDSKMFSGSWRHQVTPREGSSGPGCTITLTEDGCVASAIPRGMMNYLADPAMYLKRHLKVLARKFGEAPRLSDIAFCGKPA